MIQMTKKQKLIFSISVFALVIGYFVISYFIKYDIKVIVNNPKGIILSSQPRLEDDFYDYINFKYLKEDHLKNSKYWSPVFTEAEDKLDEEKNKIVKDILLKCGTYDQNDYLNNICEFNESFNNSSSEKNKEELNKYINIINNSTTIEEYLENIININNELTVSILYSPILGYDMDNDEITFSLYYMSFNSLIPQESIREEEVYLMGDYPELKTFLSRKQKEILEKYGYSKEDANNIVNRVEKMYQEMYKSVNLKTNPSSPKIYTKEDLQKELVNLNIDNIVKNNYIYNKIGKNKISVENINYLKFIDSYLKEENLQILKDYASSTIIYLYYSYIGEEFNEIETSIDDYMTYIVEGKITKPSKETLTRDEYKTDLIKILFINEINEEIYKKNFTESELEFYENLIKEEINIYITNVDNADWLDENTKANAKKKLEKMTYSVAKIDLSKHNKFKYDFSKSYMDGFIKINKIEYESIISNILDNEKQKDQSIINAYYEPQSNSISILMGILYAVKQSYNITSDNINEKYYELLGTIGTVIGHELTHSLDTKGSQYDEDGNLNNWWTPQDKLNFRSKNLKVVKYYDNYKVNGANTVGENAADLGGMNIVLTIAQNHNATENDYKKIFESYAKLWCSQYSSLVTKILLKDEHSLDKVRVNAVLSSTDKFYEVYNIKKCDKMYVEKNKRVSVW